MKKTLKLVSGFDMPRVALGSWKSPKEVMKTAIKAAI